MTTNEERMREISREERTAHEYSRALTKASLVRQEAAAAALARRAPDPAYEKRRAEQQAATEAARAKVAEIQAERAKEQEAALEVALAPVKDQRRRAWLAEHPAQSSWTFDHTVWPLIRPEIVSAMQQATVNATVDSLRKTGRYDF